MVALHAHQSVEYLPWIQHAQDSTATWVVEGDQQKWLTHASLTSHSILSLAVKIFVACTVSVYCSKGGAWSPVRSIWLCISILSWIAHLDWSLLSLSLILPSESARTTTTMTSSPGLLSLSDHMALTAHTLQFIVGSGVLIAAAVVVVLLCLLGN